MTGFSPSGHCQPFLNLATLSTPMYLAIGPLPLQPNVCMQATLKCTWAESNIIQGTLYPAENDLAYFPDFSTFFIIDVTRSCRIDFVLGVCLFVVKERKSFLCHSSSVVLVNYTITKIYFSKAYFILVITTKTKLIVKNFC